MLRSATFLNCPKLCDKISTKNPLIILFLLIACRDEFLFSSLILEEKEVKIAEFLFPSIPNESSEEDEEREQIGEGVEFVCRNHGHGGHAHPTRAAAIVSYFALSTHSFSMLTGKSLQ